MNFWDLQTLVDFKSTQTIKPCQNITFRVREFTPLSSVYLLVLGMGVTGRRRTQNPRSFWGGTTPGRIHTPFSCPHSVTPSQKYSSRGGRGEVVASFGPVQGPAWSGRGGCAVKLFGCPEENLTKPYKFMFQKALDVREGARGAGEVGDSPGLGGSGAVW